MRVLLASLFAGCSATEWAIVNLIRHGERTDDKANPHLAADGHTRAQYIAKCASKVTPSLAFPLGPPTHLLSSLRIGPHGEPKSVRPYETIEPLAKKLGLHLGNNVHMADTERFVQYIFGLPAGATAMISWQHWWITWLLKTLYPNAPAFPNYCPYSQWVDLPEYTHGRCYDIMFQLLLKRPSSDHHWHATAFSMMQMGFAGKNDSKCASSLEPWSNPSAWHQARCPNMPTRELAWRGDRLSASPQVRAEPGAIPLPKTHFDPALSKCESWCTPDVHMPGKSPSHCYASSCHKCDWCKGQPGSNVTNSPYYNPKSPDDAPVKGPEPSVLEHPLLLAMTLQDEDFEGGAPPVGAPTLSAVPSPLDATPEPAPGRSPLLYALASVGAAALAAAVGLLVAPTRAVKALSGPLFAVTEGHDGEGGRESTPYVAA